MDIYMDQHGHVRASFALLNNRIKRVADHLAVHTEKLQ